jgi:hypothetical protein
LDHRRHNFPLVFLHVISFCSRQREGSRHRVERLINPDVACDIDPDPSCNVEKSGGRIDRAGKRVSRCRINCEARNAEVFDPSAGTWKRWENMRFRGDLWKKCAVSSSGELYAFSGEEHQVMKYDGEKNVWTAVAFLPHFARFVHCVAQFGDWIFVTGGIWKIVTDLFNPSTGEWLEVNVGCWEGCFVIAAATVEI